MNLVNLLCNKLDIKINEIWEGTDGNCYKITEHGDLIRYFFKDNLEEDVFQYEDDISRVLRKDLVPINYKDSLLKKVCKELNLSINEEWGSNFGGVRKITEDGYVVFWNPEEIRWEEDINGWRNLLIGFLKPKKRSDKNGFIKSSL